MALPIQKVTQAAYKMFSSGNLGGMTDLIKKINKLTAKDVNFNLETAKLHKKAAPAAYVHLFEDDVMSMGIFVLKEGTNIPLHDHPNMYGICKVIHGNVTVKSFSPCVPPNSFDNQVGNSKEIGGISDNLFPAKLWEVLRVSADDEKSCVLSPNEGNIHEIIAENGPAAFLDILAPPYDYKTGARMCQYYTENSKTAHSGGKSVHWLEKISPPNNFWCDEIDYNGPEIKIY